MNNSNINSNALNTRSPMEECLVEQKYRRPIAFNEKHYSYSIMHYEGN
jgi:hypothetical protein